MIETILLKYLGGILDVPVRMSKPEPAPDAYVLIQKTGSGRENLIDTALIAIQSYAPSRYEAAALNDTVKRVMLDSIAQRNISDVALNSDYDYTDTTKKGYRYQAVFEVTYFDE